MTPLVRQWITERTRNNGQALRTRLSHRHRRDHRGPRSHDYVLDLIDHAFYAFHRRLNVVWDDWTRVHGDLRGVAAAADATLGTPPPALSLMLPCPTCGAHANAPCVSRYGETTGAHKARRTAAMDAGELADRAL